MQGSFSEEHLKNFQDLVQFSEGMPEAYDFTRCVRTDGTYYGTRGLCAAPNKPAQPAAPKPVNRGLTQAERSAFKAGGGNAAGMKGKSIDETIAQGKKNLGRMDQGRGRTVGQVPGNKLTTAEQSAYKSGGGNAQAVKTGQSINEVIAQGKKNLGRMDQGAGRTASSLTQPAPQRAPQAAAKAAPKPAPRPSVPQGATSGLTQAERSAYKAGGGNAAAMKKGQSIDEVIAQGNKNLGKMDQGAGRTAGQVPGNKLTTAEQAAYKAGGGNAKAMKGMSIDEVIAQGRKNLKRMDQGSGRTGSSLTQPAPQRSSNG